MKTLVNNQENEEQVNVNETEKIQGGGNCEYVNICPMNWGDEDNSENVAF